MVSASDITENGRTIWSHSSAFSTSEQTTSSCRPRPLSGSDCQGSAKGPFRTLLEHDRTAALVGAIVLEEFDFLVDPGNQRLVPRDPHRILAEVE